MADMGLKSTAVSKSGGWLSQNGRFAKCYDQLGACLGSGGMGSVWAARIGDCATSDSLCPGRAAGTWVAVKAIPMELEDGERSAGSLHNGLRECLSTFRDLSPVHVVRYDSYWIEEQEHLPPEIIRRFGERGRPPPRPEPQAADPPSASSSSDARPPRRDSEDATEECPKSPGAGSDIVSLRFCDGATDTDRFASDRLSVPTLDRHRSGTLSTPIARGGGHTPSITMFSNATDSCGFIWESGPALPFASLGGNVGDRAAPPPPERSPHGPPAAREAAARKRPANIVLLIEMELMGPKPLDSGKFSEMNSTARGSTCAEERLTLRAWLNDSERNGGRTFSHAADVFGMLMLSVRHIHRKRLVHADLKPDNIFLVADNHSNSDRERDRSKVIAVRIGDFGLAGENQLFRQFSYGVLKKSAPAGGTPGYVAPEVLSVEDCPVSDKADIYACAVILLEVLLPPFGTVMERSGFLERFRVRNAVPEFLEVRLPKTRALLRDMGAEDPACRLSAEEVCKRFEKEVRKELCRLSVQRCCSPSVRCMDTTRRLKPLKARSSDTPEGLVEFGDHEGESENRRHKKGKRGKKGRGR